MPLSYSYGAQRGFLDIGYSVGGLIGEGTIKTFSTMDLFFATRVPRGGSARAVIYYTMGNRVFWTFGVALAGLLIFFGYGLVITLKVFGRGAV